MRFHSDFVPCRSDFRLLRSGATGGSSPVADPTVARISRAKGLKLGYHQKGNAEEYWSASGGRKYQHAARADGSVNCRQDRLA